MNGLDNGRTILLVENEAALRRALGEVLRRSGYHVLKACGAPEALRIQERHRGTIHAMVTDVGLNGTSGPELAGSLQTARPGTPVLFMSGSFPKSLSFARTLSEPWAAFLQKPFFLNSLLRALESLLEARGEEGAREVQDAQDVRDIRDVQEVQAEVGQRPFR